jgi:hypothetical protein
MPRPGVFNRPKAGLYNPALPRELHGSPERGIAAYKSGNGSKECDLPWDLAPPARGSPFYPNNSLIGWHPSGTKY